MRVYLFECVHNQVIYVNRKERVFIMILSLCYWSTDLYLYPLSDGHEVY